MQLSQLRRPLQAAALSICRICAPPVFSASALLAPRVLPSPTFLAGAAVEGRRYASVKKQGAYKIRSNKTVAKKLGAKRVGDQYVQPGDIIYRQRGTKWFPGENAHMGRDFTIHASVAGWVKYYRDPNLHPRRQYIGVAFERDHVLPRDPTAPRPRRLDMVETPMPPPEVAAQKPTASESPIATATTTAANSTPSSGSLSDIPPSVLRRLEPGERPGTERLLVRGPEGSSGSLAYAYREQNWRIGRLVDTRLRAVMGGKGVTGRVVARRRRAERERERARRRRERAALGVAGVKPEKVLEVKGGKKERAGKRKEKKKAKA